MDNLYLIMPKEISKLFFWGLVSFKVTPVRPSREAHTNVPDRPASLDGLLA